MWTSNETFHSLALNTQLILKIHYNEDEKKNQQSNRFDLAYKSYPNECIQSIENTLHFYFSRLFLCICFRLILFLFLLLAGSIDNGFLLREYKIYLNTVFLLLFLLIISLFLVPRFCFHITFCIFDCIAAGYTDRAHSESKKNHLVSVFIFIIISLLSKTIQFLFYENRDSGTGGKIMTRSCRKKRAPTHTWSMLLFHSRK